MGFVLGVLIAQGLLGKSAMSLDLKGAIVTIPQFTFLLPVQPPKASCPPWEFCTVTSSHLSLLVDSRPVAHFSDWAGNHVLGFFFSL